MEHRDMTANRERDWSKTPIVVFTGLIASFIAIFVFVTGKNSIPEALATSTPVTPSINQYSQPTPTSTLTPTVPPTEVEISTPTPSPVLDGAPKDWLPSSDDIPIKLEYYQGVSVSNEDVAKFYENPTEVFNNLKEWGRITGFYNQYYDGCHSKSEMREILVQTVLYKNALGAQKGLDWAISYNEDQNPKEISELGENGYLYWVSTQNICDPPEDTRYVNMLFRRLNVIGVVSVGSVEGTISDDDMLSLAIRLGKLIDLRLVSNAGN